MEKIIPERFIRMCRLLEINTFPIHWKFEEKDQQIVVTFIWNIVTSEILNPQKTVPKTESKSSESKTDPDKKQKHSASHRREPTKKDSACKSEINAKEASNTDKRRFKSNSSSRSTSPTTSTEERKSVTSKHNQKSVDDRFKDSQCKKIQTISCSKPNNPSDSVIVGIGRVKNEQSSDSKKIPQKSSSKHHRHPSSNSDKKHTISSSKHVTSDKEDCKVRPSSDTKHRHSSSSSEKSSSSCKNSKSCGDFTKQNIGSKPKVHITANPETIACENSRIPEPQEKVKHNETIDKDHSLRNLSLRVDKTCESSSHDEKRHSKSSSQDLKEHTVSSSRHVKEKKDPRSRCEKTNNDAILQSEKTHKKLNVRCEKTEKVPCSRENLHKDPQSEKNQRVSPSQCEKTEKVSNSRENSQKTSNPQGGETSKVLKWDHTPKDASARCEKVIKESRREQTIIEPSSRKEETIKESQIKQKQIEPIGEKAHKDAKCDKSSKVSASKCDKSHNEPRCERTTTKQSLHCKQTFQKSKHSVSETPTDSKCDRTIIKDANSECEQKLKETSLQSEQTVTENKDAQCEQPLKELDLQREKTVQESVPKCDLTPKDSSSRCEKTINDIDKNTPSSGSKIKSKKETTHSSQDRSKDSRKSNVNTNRAKSKDATVKVTVSSKPKETTDSSSSGLSKGKRRKDVIEGEQPKKPKIDISKDIPSPSSEACIPKKLSNSVGSPQCETPSEESSIEVSHQIPKQPCTKESVSSDIPLESTTILPKNDLWQMFVSRCKVKTDVNFANQAEKEPIVQHCPVDPEPAVKADQNTKSRQATEHIKLPHKENKSTRDRKSLSENKVHKKGSTTTPKGTITNNTSKSKRSSKSSSENIPNSKESSKKSIEKNLPASGPSDNAKLTPVSRPKGTSLQLEKLPKDSTPEKKCTNTESVNEAKASREEYAVPNNDRPKELHHDGHGLSDDDEDYNQLKIDLEQFESRASEHEDEVLKEKEKSQTQTNGTLIQSQKPNPEISIAPSELKIDNHPSESVSLEADPALDRADDEMEISLGTNTSIETIESVKDLVPASSHQKTTQEAKVRNDKKAILSSEPKGEEICRKGLVKDAMCSNELVDGEVYRNNLEEEDAHKNKRMEGEKEIHRNNLDDGVLINEQEEKDLHSSKQIVEEMYNNEQDEEKTKSNNLDGMAIDSNELEEGEIEDNENLESKEADERDDNNSPTHSPVSSTDAQIDDDPLEVIESNGSHETFSRNQVENRTEATTKPQTDGIRSPSSIYSFLTEDVDNASRSSTPLLDEPKVSKETNINTQILPKTEGIRDKECSQVKSQVVIPRKRKRGKRKKTTDNKINERNWPTSLADILQDKRLSKGKRSRLLKKLRKELLELPASSHEDINGKIRKEQKKLWKANHDAKLWTEPKSQGHQETSCRSEEYVSDWDNLLQQHISQMKRPKSKDSKTENLDMKIDNFLIEMDLSDSKRCPSTFLPPNQTYKENINTTKPSGKVPKKVNFGNLIDVQSYTGAINHTSSDDPEQFDHDSLMDSIIISSTYQDENREETHKKRKRHTLDSDSDSEAESDPESRKSQRSISRRLPRMNRDIAIKQRTNPDTGIHQYLFLYEDSRPCTWVDSDEIKDYNPHFYNSLKKCFVPKEDSQEKSELQQKLYSLVGFPP